MPTADSRQPTLQSLLRLAFMGCGLLAVGSCNEISSPLRGDIYGRSIIVEDVVTQDTVIDGVSYEMGEMVTDTVDFAWRAGDLPIKVWVHDSAGLPADFRAAVTAWQGVLVFGEVAVQYVSDSSTAQIIVVLGSPPPAPGAPTGAVAIRLQSAPAACEGATDIQVSAPDHTKLWTPIRIYMTPKYLLSDPETKACLRRATIHELGHALGLFKHSPDSLDIMFPFPRVDSPSDADAATIQFLYHQTPDLRARPATDTIPGVPFMSVPGVTR